VIVSLHVATGAEAGTASGASPQICSSCWPARFSAHSSRHRVAPFERKTGAKYVPPPDNEMGVENAEADAGQFS
jgi:hypothetical protein